MARLTQFFYSKKFLSLVKEVFFLAKTMIGKFAQFGDILRRQMCAGMDTEI
jgi:hypothetical protein